MNRARGLFLDDSERILQASKKAGIGFQLGIKNPDTQKGHTQFHDFPAIDDYHHLLDELLNLNVE